MAEAPGVRIGAGVLGKNLLVRCDAIGEVTDIAYGRIDGDDRERLILGGTRGFALVDLASANVERTVEFALTGRPELEGNATDCRIVDADGDGDLEFARLAASWIGRTSLHGSDGKAKWVHPDPRADPDQRLSVDETVCGDVDGDGAVEFLIAFDSVDESELIDDSGALVWSRPIGLDFVGAPLLLDVDEDGRDDIVFVDGDALWARDGAANVVARTQLPDGGYVNDVQLLRAFGEPPRDRLVVGEHVKHGPHRAQSYYLVALDAKSVGRRVERSEVERYRDATTIGFAGNPALAYARIESLNTQAWPAGFSATRLWLRVFDRGRNVVYEEILAPPDGEKASKDGALEYLASTPESPAMLLVAYGPVVWAYTPKR